MFEHDRAASRGEITTRALLCVQAYLELGNPHAHRLFERIQPKLKESVNVPRSFDDYDVPPVTEAGLPSGETLLHTC